MSGSPTFVARFVDGETARMTTYTSLTKLDVGAAYPQWRSMRIVRG